MRFAFYAMAEAFENDDPTSGLYTTEINAVRKAELSLWAELPDCPLTEEQRNAVVFLSAEPEDRDDTLIEAEGPEEVANWLEAQGVLIEKGEPE